MAELLVILGVLLRLLLPYFRVRLGGGSEAGAVFAVEFFVSAFLGGVIGLIFINISYAQLTDFQCFLFALVVGMTFAEIPMRMVRG